MSISGVSQRKTGELVDEWAHQAGTVDKDHHVTGSTAMKSGAQLHKERHADGTLGHAGKDVGIGVAKEVLPEAIEHHFPKTAGAGFVGGLAYFTYECLHELAAAEKKGEEIRSAFDNDAVNVALARSLAFDKRFGETEAAKRPGVNDASSRLSAKLNEPNNPMKAVLQGRADDGFEAAHRANAAVGHLPPSEQPAASAKWMKDNGFGDRLANDVAFGKGVEYFGWIHSSAAKELSVDSQAESAKVYARRPPPQAFQRAG